MLMIFQMPPRENAQTFRELFARVKRAVAQQRKQRDGDDSSLAAVRSRRHQAYQRGSSSSHKRCARFSVPARMRSMFERCV